MWHGNRSWKIIKFRQIKTYRFWILIFSSFLVFLAGSLSEGISRIFSWLPQFNRSGTTEGGQKLKKTEAS